MKKINIVKENNEYSRIIKTGRKIYSKNVTFFLEENKDNYLFGFSIGKKIGNAVTRNRIRRQIKSILDKKNYEKKFKCIIMVRKGILDLTYQEIENEIFYLIKKANLIEEK